MFSLQQSLQLCERGKDKHGRWVASKDVDIDELAKHIIVDTIKHGYSFERKQWISAALNTSESRFVVFFKVILLYTYIEVDYLLIEKLITL